MVMLTWIIFALASLYPLFTCDVSATSSTQLMSNQTQGIVKLLAIYLIGNWIGFHLYSNILYLTGYIYIYISWCVVCADDLLNICDFVYCGKGTCQLSSTELLGFTCDCESGWKKPNIGSIELPPCIFPNCE